MNKNSLHAYFDDKNQRKFKSNRQKIYWYMFDVKTPQSARMVEAATGIDYYSVVRRFSDLRNAGEIEYFGDIEENGNMCSLYKVVDQASLFPVPKKKTKLEQFKDDLSKQLGDWVTVCNTEIEHFSKSDMPTQELSSRSQRVAYQKVIELINN